MISKSVLSLSRARRAGALWCALLSTAGVFAQTSSAPRRSAPRRTAARQTAANPDAAGSPDAGRSSPAPARQVTSSIFIRWAGRPGVTRYRLQLATDESFSDIVFDEAVVGNWYVVKTLPPGRYFWRVAPAVGETGNFSTPKRVEATAGAAAGADEMNVLMPPGNTGWRTATGEVTRPMPAQLRAGQGFDLLGVNTDGMVFALDGSNGVALWTARFKPELQRGATALPAVVPLTPAVLRLAADRTNVIVGFDEGIRGLRGDTGRELWRTKLSGRATSVNVSDVDGDGRMEIVVGTSDPPNLYVVDGEAGRIVSQTKLDANPFGAPALVVGEKGRDLLIGLSNTTLELRSAGGALTHSTKFDLPLTTPPLALMTPRGQIIVVGTEAGIVALKSEDLSPIGRIAITDDAPRGTLTVADLDGDGANELIVVTKNGRVAVVSTIDGNTKWYAEGATDAASASVADLNGDGVLDVIVPAGATFARGFSGRDGSLIWKVEEEAGRRDTTATTAVVPRAFAPRSLVIAPTAEGGGGVVVGSDPARTGLRAVELPKGSVRTAAK